MPLEADVQKLNPGNIIELFDLDLSPATGASTVLRFVPSTDEGTPGDPVMWRENAYLPQPIEIEGIETSGRGALPRPRLTLSNVLGEVSTLLREHGDIRGALLTRWKTYAHYLDDGASPDPDGHFPIDEFVLDRIASRTKFLVTFELRVVFDRSDMLIPRRQVLRDICTHSYRVWDPVAEAFDYTGISCPYAGEDSFDRADEETSAANDRCSHKLPGCRARFGTAPLPFRGFPAAGRIR